MKLFKYTVTGIGYFPYDMLRYDSAWPSTSNDAWEIGPVFRPAGTAYSVTLTSIRQPTVERWMSFGWAVGNAVKIH